MIKKISEKEFNVNGKTLTYVDLYDCYKYISDEYDEEDIECLLRQEYSDEEVDTIISNQIFRDIVEEFKDYKANDEGWVVCGECAIDYYKNKIKELINNG